MRINSNYAHLIPSEKKLADYISKHTEHLETHSINELADLAGVSKATITRFCKHLGFEGFKDFRVSAIKDTISGQDNWSDVKVAKEDDTTVLIAKTCKSNANACSGTEILLDVSGVEQAVQLLLDAKRIFIFGEGAVAPVALDLYQKLLRIGNIPVYSLDRRLQKMHAALSTPDDVAIVFDLSGSTIISNTIAEKLKSNKTKTITVCNTLGSPLGKAGDINLFGPGRMNSDVTGTQAPRIALFCVVDCLFSLILQKVKVKCHDSLEKTKQVIVDEWL